MRNQSITLSLAMALVGCMSGPTGTQVNVDGPMLQVDLGTFEVPAGDTLTCFSSGFVTDQDYAIGGAAGMQATGGHHLSVYWTMDATEFAPRPCRDEDMINWNFIAGVGGEPGAGDDQALPEGLAFRLPAGAQIVIQAHYINASGSAQNVHDTLDIELLSPTVIDGYAALFAVNDGALEVPPRARYRRISECRVTQPLSVVMMLGHMHEHGSFFSVELTRAGAATSETLYEHEWASEYTAHPPVIRWPTDDALTFQVGDVIRQTCEWNNTSSDTLVFPSEMCVTTTYYFPDVGEGLIVCDPTVMIEETF